MKITREGDTGPFNSYTIKIKVECQGDEDVMENLGRSNISLPDLLSKSRHVTAADTRNFCRKLNDIYGNR